MIPYLLFWVFIIIAGIFAGFFIAREILSIGATRKLCCSIGKSVYFCKPHLVQNVLLNKCPFTVCKRICQKILTGVATCLFSLSTLSIKLSFLEFNTIRYAKNLDSEYLFGHLLVHNIFFHQIEDQNMFSGKNQHTLPSFEVNWSFPYTFVSLFYFKINVISKGGMLF